jgi:hypothetical protein
MATYTVAAGKRATYKESSATNNTYVINDDTKGATISGSVNGDIIAIEGFAADFTASVSGRVVTLKSTVDTAVVIKFQLASTTGSTASVRFLDGDLTATYTAATKKVTLGAQTLSSKAAAVNDSALGANDSSSTFDESSGSNGTSYTLSSDADDIPGTDGNDTITGAAGRLAAGDDINGGAGTDILDVTTLSTALDLSLTNVEDVRVKILSGTATWNFAAVDTAVTSITVTGVGNARLQGLDNNENVVLGKDYAKTVIIEAPLLDATADSVNIKLQDAGSAYLYSSSIENVNIYSLGSANDVTVVNLDSVANINVLGDKDVTLRMASAYATSGFSGLDADVGFETTIDSIGATGLSANLTLYVGFSASSGMAVNGGAGNDNFTFASGYLPVNVTVDGGAGTDTLSVVQTAGNWLARATNVEVLNLDIGAGAGTHTANLNLMNALTTLTIGNLASATDFSALGTTLKTINISDELAATANAVFDFKSGSTTVAINLNELSSAATGVGLGNVTIGTVGSVTLNNNGKSSANFLGNLTVNSANTLAMNINSDLSLSALAASEADTVTITSTGDLLVSNTTTFATANTVTIDYTQAATAIGTGFAMSAVSLGATTAAASMTAGEYVTFNLNARGSTTAGTVLIADLSAASLSDLNISANNADVTITSFAFGASANANSANIAVQLDLNAAQTGDDIIIRTITTGTAGSAASWQTGNGSLTINAFGSGNVSLGTANAFLNVASGNTAAIVNATGLAGTFTFFATGSTGLAFNMRLGNDVASANLIKLGDGNDSVLGGANADTIYGGAGADTIDGNGGADVIYGGAGADSIVGGSGAATIDGGAGNDTLDMSQGQNSIINSGFVVGAANASLGAAGDDTVISWGSGDVIKFTAANIVLNTAANGQAGTAIASGSFTYFTAAASWGTAASGAELGVAIYQNGSDTIIHFNIGTATAAAGTGQTITLQNVTGWTSLTAAFKVSFGASGLYIIGL